MISGLKIKPFPLKTATEHEYRAANALDNALRAERLPDDPPIPLEEEIQRLQNIPAFVDVYAWGVWSANESAMVARASANFLRMETNKHLAEFDIQVLPEYRRRGIARELLERVADTVRANERTLMLADTTERIPAGEAFMRRLGARKGMERHTNQLDLKDLNRDLIGAWQERARERAADFEIGLWDGAYPEEYLQEIANLLNVMNTAPRDNLELEDFNITPERLRQFEHSLFVRGTERWTMYVRERATNKFAGFTEVVWNRNRPEILDQHGTGVLPPYRSRGLGRWLKAAMLDKVLRERPQVKFVRTGNADSNAAMLKINFELEFKPYISECVWQVEIGRVLEYLGEREKAHA